MVVKFIGFIHPYRVWREIVALRGKVLQYFQILTDALVYV